MRLIACFLFIVSLAAAAETKTKNVLLVTIDGLRWQEVFGGADEALMTSDAAGGGISSGALPGLRAEFLAPTPEERRKKLMPFFWGTIVPRGQAFGNRALASAASVLNAERVSYPGY